MGIIKTKSYSRVGFLGNPSDGYFGKTISIALGNFSVVLTLTESSRLRFVPGEVDDQTFESIESLVHEVRLYGCYGGIRILKAVTKRFFDYSAAMTSSCRAAISWRSTRSTFRASSGCPDLRRFAHPC